MPIVTLVPELYVIVIRLIIVRFYFSFYVVNFCIVIVSTSGYFLKFLVDSDSS